MATVLLVLVVVLVIAALVFGVVTLLTGDDPGLSVVEADGRALPLPNNRSLTEVDLKKVRFDVELRGYRMAQVDRVLRRTAYDVGYKDEMIAVLEAEVIALREGRTEDAELLRKARESAASPAPVPSGMTNQGPGMHQMPNAIAFEEGSDEIESDQEATMDAMDDGADVRLADVEAPDERDHEKARDHEHEDDTKLDGEQQRLDEDVRPQLTEDLSRGPTGDLENPEEKAPRD